MYSISTPFALTGGVVSNLIAPGYRVKVLATANLVNSGEVVWWDFKIPHRPHSVACFTKADPRNSQLAHLIANKTREEITLIFGYEGAFTPIALICGEREIPCFSSIWHCKREDGPQPT